MKSRRSILVQLLAFAILLGILAPAQGALERPSYRSGDRWIYTLDGTINGFPGLDPQAVGSIELFLASRVEVEVLGAEDANVLGRIVPVTRVAMRSTGFFNGTFAFPGGPFPGPVSVAGSFVANGTELWENEGYFPIESRSTSTYAIDLSTFIVTRIDVRIRINATNEIAQVPAFPLDVGERTSVETRSTVTVNSTVDAFGQTRAMEETNTVRWNWSREVLGSESVHVDPGDFVSYRLNQSLSDIPGIAGVGLFGIGNETAYASNDVGYYVQRTAYLNGTAVATQRLKSFVYAASQPAGLSVPLLLGLGAALGAVGAGVAVLAVRRKRGLRNADIPGEVSPKEPGP